MRTLARIELKGAFTQLAPSFVFNAFIGKNAELFGVGDGGCLMPSGAEGGKRVSVLCRGAAVDCHGNPVYKLFGHSHSGRKEDIS